jgi:type 1 glutamine amidotransferase
MRHRTWIAPAAAVLCAAGWSGAREVSTPQPPPASTPARQAVAGGPGSSLLRAFDSDKDGTLTAAEMSGTFDRWYSAADTANTGSITAQQLGGVIDGAMPPEADCGGRSATPRVPCQKDVDAMLAALPDAASAKPKKPRRILVLSTARGFVHSSIPLAARTIEELGKKTGAWTATTTYQAADINTQNLAQYDAIVLNNTTGFFLDQPGDDAAHEARKAALMAFLRSGKGIAGLHAASDGYHGDPATARTTAPPGTGGGLGVIMAPMFVAQADRNGDAKLTREELTALGQTWFSTLAAGAEKVSVAEAAPRMMAAAMGGPRPGGPRPAGPPPPNVALWPEFNRAIGGWFKWHWNDPQLIAVRLDDPGSPINAPFKGQSFEIRDETYTFPTESWSRDNVRVLTSVDYAKMSDEDKAKEPAATRRTDGDYGLCWVRREGQGRLFYEAHGHSERVYAIRPWLAHVVAGVQYALGDLDADATPRPKTE